MVKVEHPAAAAEQAAKCLRPGPRDEQQVAGGDEGMAAEAERAQADGEQEAQGKAMETDDADGDAAARQGMDAAAAEYEGDPAWYEEAAVLVKALGEAGDDAECEGGGMAVEEAEYEVEAEHAREGMATEEAAYEEAQGKAMEPDEAGYEDGDAAAHQGMEAAAAEYEEAEYEGVEAEHEGEEAWHEAAHAPEVAHVAGQWFDGNIVVSKDRVCSLPRLLPRGFLLC